MKFQLSHHLPFTLRKTWLTEAPHHGQWMQLGFSFWKENAIQQRVVQKMFYLENVRQIVSGKSYRKWQEWSDPLLKLQYLKEEFDSNPNLYRAERNPDWELNRQQCTSERKELASACLKFGQARNLLLISTLAEQETGWYCVLTVFKKYLKYKNISVASTQKLFCRRAKYYTKTFSARKINKGYKSFEHFYFAKTLFLGQCSLTLMRTA